MNKGANMLVYFKIRILILSLLLILIGGIGHTDSDIPLVFEYDLPIANDQVYASHSVTFSHGAHATEYKIACIKCHHMLEDENSEVEDNCVYCHEDTDVRRYQEFRKINGEDRIDYWILAIHDQCINCHKEIKEENFRAKAPVACWGCHIRRKQ